MTDPKTEFPEYNLTDGELRAKVSKDHTLDIASFLPWTAVGEYLPGIDNQDVKDINVDGRDEPDKRRMLLGLWKTRNGGKATYGVLIAALLKARETDQAEEVCKLLRPGGPVPTAPAAEPSPGGTRGGPKGPKRTSLEDSPGLAILVNCTYENTPNRLPGTAEDAKAMLDTFNNLHYIVHQLSNPTGAEIRAKMTEICQTLEKYNMLRPVAEEKVIIFAFSGHGITENNLEKIHAEDGEKIELDGEIVFPLTRPEGVQFVPKLFFIDACRGPLTVTGKGSGAQTTIPPDNELLAKNNQVFVAKFAQRIVGNYYIAYATVPDHVSWTTENGSVWMLKLAKYLWKDTDSFQNIIDKVKREVSLRMGQHMQQCSCDGRLNTGPLYLQKKK